MERCVHPTLLHLTLLGLQGSWKSRGTRWKRRWGSDPAGAKDSRGGSEDIRAQAGHQRHIPRLHQILADPWAGSPRPRTGAGVLMLTRHFPEGPEGSPGPRPEALSWDPSCS